MNKRRKYWDRGGIEIAWEHNMQTNIPNGKSKKSKANGSGNKMTKLAQWCNGRTTDFKTKETGF